MQRLRRRQHRMGSSAVLSLLTLLLCSGVARGGGGGGGGGEEQTHDAREGEDVTLQCRFAPQPAGGAAEPLTYYWVRTTPSMHDNVAIGNIPLQTNYQLSYQPHEGRYDLLISNASYERDNGRFECRVKAGGSGRTLHAQAHALVVLTPPRPPQLSSGARAHAQEDRPLQLLCASSGGSPEPNVRWYREGSSYPLEAEVSSGGSRANATTATLTLTPTRDDDGAVFRCAVWNRAMPDGDKFEASVTLSVNYFPRVEVGPENPLRVEVDGTASMECRVDAKPGVSSVRWSRGGKLLSNSFTYTLQAVSVDDAGKYTCSADNNLGRVGEREIYLDVLYPPRVRVHSNTHEAEEGGSVDIRCNVSANPEPVSVEWSKEGRPDYRLSGPELRLRDVTSDAAGTYICRATNVITTAGGKRVERIGSASVAVLVRHRPGRARISPDRPVAHEGAGVTLTCAASPPGWPAPQYRWFRESDAPPATAAAASSAAAVLATGARYTIPSAHLGSEGVYHCQATNELGHGERASVQLEVHQPPRVQTKLQPHQTRRAGESDFSVACAALGKPRPAVRWLKDGVEIAPDLNRYEVKSEQSESRNGVVSVHSSLRFSGKARTDGVRLMPADRGVYSCVFENEVKRVESSMHLRIEHEPIALQQQHKVASELHETAEVVCRVQAYPRPDFHWFFGANSAALQMSSDGYYEINTTTDANDSYISVLRIRSVRAQDYGDYSCKVKNSLGQIKPQIRLQPKGAPEQPRELRATSLGHDYVTLAWEPGFDGGLAPKYFVRYRRVALAERDVVSAECADMSARAGDWQEFDCGRRVPCNVTGLDQHRSFLFKVKAVNTKGQSNFSNEISKTTKVDRIPSPERVTYDPSTRTLALSVGGTCLALTGVAEALAAGGWRVVETVPLQLSGTAATHREVALEAGAARGAGGARALPDAGAGAPAPPSPLDELDPRLRVKLCLRISQEHCGDYVEAEIGPAYIKEASALTTPTLIAIVVSCLVFVVFLSLLVVFCRCKRGEGKKQTAKDYEMESVRPSMVAQNQAPPPYYPASGMENKALEHSMDLALMDDPKAAVYATQNGYGYHVAPNMHPGMHPGMHAAHPTQNINGADWVNMGYIENSYTNSNNGGSVNSQDSLWQMKMAAAANNGGGGPGGPGGAAGAHQIMERQSSYGYDPIAHGGYGAVDDYAPYPHLGHASPNMVDEYGMRASQNPSRQEYCTDPYASVHKPKKRIDQHMAESAYHDVSGLPDPYLEPMEGEEPKPPQHLSLSYDESLESGYSTPNSRTRRVIREIIV